MKKLLTLLLIFSAFTSSAQIFQVDPSPGRTIAGYRVKKTLFIPASCGTPSFRPVIDVPDQPAIAYDTCNHIFYVFDPTDSIWKQSGMSLDSILAHVGDIVIPQAPDSSVLKVKNLHGDTTNVKFVFDDGASTGVVGGGGVTQSQLDDSTAAIRSIIESGTYQPTVTTTSANAGAAGGDGSSTNFKYIRIGNIVTISGLITVVPTATGNIDFSVSLPIPSTFTTQSDATGSIGGGWQSLAGGLITANNSNNTITIGVGTTGTGGGRTFSFICQYIIK